MANNERKISTATWVVGGVAAAAAAAASAYWLYGAKNAVANRKKVSTWIWRARADVVDAVEKLRELDKKVYLGIVDQVIQKYKEVSPSNELARVTRELKAAWPHIHSAISPGGRNGTRTGGGRSGGSRSRSRSKNSK